MEYESVISGYVIADGACPSNPTRDPPPLPIVSGSLPDSRLGDAPSISSRPRLLLRDLPNTSHAQVYSTRLTWKSASQVPQTKIIAHVPGWSIIDRLYIYKGVVFIVSNEPQSIPNISAIYSKGVDIEVGEEAELARLPRRYGYTDNQHDRGQSLVWLRGSISGWCDSSSSFLGVLLCLICAQYFVNDPPQFVRHYYHWAAELWFGFWRAYSSLDPTISPSGNTTLPPPRRMWFNRLDAFRWRDYSTMNQWIVRSSFPDLTMEFIDDWDDRIKMGVPFVLERVVLADRSAAMPSLNYQRYQRTAAAAFGLPGSVHWWQTIRNNVVQFAGLDPEEGAGTRQRPVITYISRQAWGRRMLIPADHERLVYELRKLEYVYGWEVNVVVPEKMSRLEQLQLAARTTILMGVHGNGLTSLLWMKPNPRSTVMEFFYPGGFAHDYEYTTRSLGMTHYGFWDDAAFTSPDIPLPAYPEGFQGLPCRSSLRRLTIRPQETPFPSMEGPSPNCAYSALHLKRRLMMASHSIVTLNAQYTASYLKRRSMAN
ncbi:hypothetical protein MSAN_01826900 [Mycena sanguinolenta]|uniref:Glycosyltransferase 61 catalytic domain-containing protein n=1 Tax=Mycena sanguinolenta TaxID=230812 RepID=A0A8H6XTG6_9AGAR|nr:hypothetical protein MSAN_01826900 [Mycena sanguinolenta]